MIDLLKAKEVAWATLAETEKNKQSNVKEHEVELEEVSDDDAVDKHSQLLQKNFNPIPLSQKLMKSSIRKRLLQSPAKSH